MFVKRSKVEIIKILPDNYQAPLPEEEISKSVKKAAEEINKIKTEKK